MRKKSKWLIFCFFLNFFSLHPKEKEQKIPKNPFDCIFYLCADHAVNPDTIFFSYTSAQGDEPSELHEKGKIAKKVPKSHCFPKRIRTNKRTYPR
jgi:hypothetical protein